jgi:hypothetical protein
VCTHDVRSVNVLLKDARNGPGRSPLRSSRGGCELLLLAGALVADETVVRSDDALLGDWLSLVR